VRLVLLACVFALALGACDRGSSQTSSAATSTTTVAPAPAGPCPTFHGTTARAESVGSRPLGLLTDATAGAAGCLDQVTFTFRSVGSVTPPGYVVEYQTPPFSNGDPPRAVTLDGSAFLSVTIAPAASVDVTQEDQPRTYFGNLLLQYGEHHHLVLVEKFDDSLGAVRWVIALDAKRPFVVDSATDPTRITVYIG
jgi:hypothetical protein